MKAHFKLITILFLILNQTLLSGFLSLIPVAEFRVQHWRSKLKLYFSRWGLKVLGVELELKGQLSKLDHGQGRFVVCNHLSYIDILIISSIIPVCFVTSQEIKETPGLGWMARWAGCVFVERRNKENIINEIDEICKALRNGVHVVVFPEATSTNGERVLNFKSPLYTSAISATSEIQPLCLNYISIDGKPLSRENRDQIFWYGDMNFFPHLKQLMKFKKIKASLEIIKTIKTIEIENQVAIDHRKDFKIELDYSSQHKKVLARYLADKTHSYISERFQPCL